MALRKNPESRPQISDVSPPAAIPGGEFRIRGKGLAGAERPTARFGDLSAPVVIGSDSLVIVRVPEGVSRGELKLGKDEDTAWTCDIGIQIAEGMHPVSNPAVDKLGNIYTTFSGSAGQKTAGFDLQNRQQPGRQAAGHRHDERHRPGAGRRGGAVLFQPP